MVALTASLIELETLDFAEAAQALVREVAEPVGRTVRASFHVLEECSGMAGSDPGGSAWASAYDRAAAAATSATTSAVQGVEQLARMFGQTARNYEAADAASAVAVRRRLASAVAHLPAVPDFWLPTCMPPTAAGSSGGGPPGWGLIEDAVGYVWPNGHQDRLRRAASAWRDSALALAAAAQLVTDAPQAACRHQLPESDDMWMVCWSVGGDLRELSDVHGALGSACADLAHHLDRVHSEVLGELASLVEWSAGIQAVGGLLSVVSFGLAEAPTQAVQAARIARTATLVGGCIERFLAAAQTLTTTVAALAERAQLAGSKLGALLGARLLEPVLVGVGPTRVLHEAKEVRAVARLEAESAVALRYIDNPQLFDPRVLRGMKLEDVRAAVPKSWKPRPSTRGGGQVWEDPAHPGRRIRLMPGYPKGSRPGLVNEGPYVVVSQNGGKVTIPLAGNPELR